MKRPIRRSGAEIIAFHFCSDIADIRESVYQPTRYRAPYVYTVGNDYFCCPAAGQTPPKHRDHAFDWHSVGTYYGRTVYQAHGGD